MRAHSILSSTDKGAENRHRKLMFPNTQTHIPYIQMFFSIKLVFHCVAFSFCDAPNRVLCEWMSIEYVLRDINSPFMLCVINKSEIYIDRPMELTTAIQIVCCAAAVDHIVWIVLQVATASKCIRSRRNDVKRQKFVWHVYELNHTNLWALNILYK